jgi:hypothetical protein
MSITAKVHRGSVTLPPHLEVPDGTEVEIVIPNATVTDSKRVRPIRLPVFNGDGLQSDVNLNDSRAVRRILDDPIKLSQLP